MDENIKIKEELFSLYNNLKDNIFDNTIKTNETQKTEDINCYNSLSLIKTIKDLIPLLLINQKTTEINTNTFNNDNNRIKSDYIQLEKFIIKLENDNKFYLRKYMQYKIQKDSLEAKLNAYMALEDEYEELKEKVKYDGGKFLDNDRKDNEIIILRRENSALKKEIVKFEIRNKKNDLKSKEYQNKIKELQSSVDDLNKKIYKLEKIIKNNNLKNSNSSNNLRIKSSENYSSKKNNCNSDNSMANLNNVINFNINNTHNNRRLFNFQSPKNEMTFLEQNRHSNNNTNNTINGINSHIFTGSYTKVINGIINKKIKIPINKQFTHLKQPRNNSISFVKGRETEKNKTLIKAKHLHKSGSTYNIQENKIFTLNSKYNNFYPISCKHSNNNGQIVRRYIQREFNRNSSSQTIKEMH